MVEQELRFSGSVPQTYDHLLVPMLFRPYAEELARRARAFAPRRIVETAAGTGALTEALSAALPDSDIVATDLNQPMLDVAAARLRSSQIVFVAADAQQLPLPSGQFDLVVCQFGAMFFPDRVKAHGEARRLLKPAGHYLLAIWDRIERNPVSEAAQQALITCFPKDPPLFMREGPFGYHDRQTIELDLHNAGFHSVQLETVELRSRSPSASDAAAALFHGSPMGVEVEEREAGSGERVFAEVEEALRPFEGPKGIDAPMAAHIITATK